MHPNKILDSDEDSMTGRNSQKDKEKTGENVSDGNLDEKNRGRKNIYVRGFNYVEEVGRLFPLGHFRTNAAFGEIQFISWHLCIHLDFKKKKKKTTNLLMDTTSKWNL